MERNGLEGREREGRIGLWILGICGFFLISLFVAPLTMASGTVPALSGRANALDYMTKNGKFSWGNQQASDDAKVGHDQESRDLFAWTDLNWYAAFIYGFGDLNCHQRTERSWTINGNQMPMCVRDIGIFAGGMLAGALWRKRGLNRWTIRDSLFSLMPDSSLEGFYADNRRTLLLMVFAGMTLLPIGLDGGLQAITEYESTALRRMVTGLIFGFGFLAFFAASLSARPSFFESPAQVVLPAGASFVRAEDQDAVHQASSEE